MLENLLVVWSFVGFFSGITVFFVRVLLAALQADETKSLTDRILLVVKPFGIALAFAVLWPAIFCLFGVNILYWIFTGKNISLVDKFYSLT